MLTHEDHVAELAAQLEDHRGAPVVIEDLEGKEYEIGDVCFENVNGRDQIAVSIQRK